ncbi:hypothetical protein A3K86_06550 [Photobacterium jeanii]|uniref:Beta-lactamase-related domain-containing protein n=1 Tax=Photobacterium jeanii TaxID=858640 RepID=A0A178KPE8_9GAMM|nr:serine hydrolase [Photobacterium jeanii]OAN18543.1 hypothetical protein A3K86_06550 [Photobacterium jeanii]PST91775.1 serine hydrolase [Photobacterium jeanii]
MLTNSELKAQLSADFSQLAQQKNKLGRSFLLVHSDKLDFHLELAQGTDETHIDDCHQPVHLASVGKLFTSVLIGLLVEERLLRFDDPVSLYLDSELCESLEHLAATQPSYNISNLRFSDQLTVRHLLMQTSGLPDVFFPLMEKLKAGELYDPTATSSVAISPREAILWGCEHLKYQSALGTKHVYTDTNYYLLGLIIEQATGMTFQQAIQQWIFAPLAMDHAWLHGLSKPSKSCYQPANLYIDEQDFLAIKGSHLLDYAGGSVIAPLPEYLTFMQSLVNGKLLNSTIVDQMVSDDIAMGFPALGFRYGYGVWKTRPIPLLLPKNHYCWGCVGVTGAFMFYHPQTETYIIGTFNNNKYREKALRFVIGNVIKKLLVLNQTLNN